MMPLNRADRNACANQFGQETTARVNGYVKSDLRAAVDAIDDWAEGAGRTAFRATVPEPVKSNMSVAEQDRLLAIVCNKRLLKGA